MPAKFSPISNSNLTRSFCCPPVFFCRPIQPFSTTTPDSISCSGSFRAVVWMCQLVVGQESDMPVCIHRVVKSLSGYVDRCTDDWIKLFMSYPNV